MELSSAFIRNILLDKERRGIFVDKLNALNAEELYKPEKGRIFYNKAKKYFLDRYKGKIIKESDAGYLRSDVLTGIKVPPVVITKKNRYTDISDSIELYINNRLHYTVVFKSIYDTIKLIAFVRALDLLKIDIYDYDEDYEENYDAVQNDLITENRELKEQLRKYRLEALQNQKRIEELKAQLEEYKEKLRKYEEDMARINKAFSSHSQEGSKSRNERDFKQQSREEAAKPKAYEKKLSEKKTSVKKEPPKKNNVLKDSNPSGDLLSTVREAVVSGQEIFLQEVLKVNAFCSIGSDKVEIRDEAPRFFYLVQEGSYYYLFPTKDGLKNRDYLISLFKMKGDGTEREKTIVPAKLFKMNLGYELIEHGKILMD